MPTTNRPFFANFFAAFKTSQLIHGRSSNPTASASSAYSALSRTYHTSTSPSPEPQQQQTSSIPIKQPPHSSSTHSAASTSATTVTTSPSQSHFRNSRPLHPSAGTPHSRSSRMRSTSRDAPVYGPHLPQQYQQPQYQQSQSQSQSQPQALASSPPSQAPPFRSRTPSPGPFPRGRRGSDASAHSSGSGSAFSPPAGSGMGAAAAEKWYIGGRTAQGEERFYKLGLVQTRGSADRLSLDRLSL